jgi:ATP-dependent protease ClpP protease subunit
MTPCMAIYDTMESIKSPVGTLALGYAYNNAGFLLGAGTKVVILNYKQQSLLKLLISHVFALAYRLCSMCI